MLPSLVTWQALGCANHVQRLGHSWLGCNQVLLGLLIRRSRLVLVFDRGFFRMWSFPWRRLPGKVLDCGCSRVLDVGNSCPAAFLRGFIGIRESIICQIIENLVVALGLGNFALNFELV